MYTVKYGHLMDEGLFADVITSGGLVVWGAGQARVTVNALMEAILL